MKSSRTVACLVLFILLFCLVPPLQDARAAGPDPWSGTIEITSDFTVAEDDVLVIEPGTDVVFKTYDWSIFIYGRVEARGTEEEPITFHGLADITNAWKGLFLYSSGNVFEWCEFENGFYAIRGYTGGQHISYCNFSTCANGVKLDGDASTIHGCTFQGMVYLGISLWGNDNVVSSCVTRDCYDGGLFLKNNTGNVISDCLINPPPGPKQWNGIRILDAYGNTFSNCTIQNCENGFYIEGNSYGNTIIDCQVLACRYGIMTVHSTHPHEEEVHIEEHAPKQNLIAFNEISACGSALMIMGEDNVIMGNAVKDSSGTALVFALDETSGNRVFLNNFQNNTKDLQDPNNSTVFNNDRNEGNYWSSNNASDEDKDGITNLPYGPDLYPLAYPLVFVNGRLEDFDTDGDGIPDYRDPDDDGDGHSDLEEIENGWDPKDPDSPDDSPKVGLTIGLLVFVLLVLAVLGLFVLLARRSDRRGGN